MPASSSSPGNTLLLNATFEYSLVPTGWLDTQGQLLRLNPALQKYLASATTSTASPQFQQLELLDTSNKVLAWEALFRQVQQQQEIRVLVHHQNGTSFTMQLVGVQSGEERLELLFLHPRPALNTPEPQDTFSQREKRYFKLFNLSPDAVILTDFETGRYYDVNEGFCRLTGYTKAQLLGKNIQQINLWHEPAERIIWMEALHKYRKVQQEIKYVRKDGSLGDSYLFSKRLTLGGVSCVLTVARDITAQKVSERKLRQSEETLRKAVQNIPVMLMAFDNSRQLLVWNNECQAVTGYSATEMIGNSNALSLLFPKPEYRELVLEQLRLDANSNQLLEWEWELTAKDGTKRIIMATFNHTINPVPGWPIWGIGVDITSRKLIQQALEESEKKFKIIANATNDAVWDWNLLTNKIWWNDGITQLFGYTVQDTGDDIAWWESCIHPLDRERVIMRIHNSIDLGEVYWSDEYRFLKKKRYRGLRIR